MRNRIFVWIGVLVVSIGAKLVSAGPPMYSFETLYNNANQPDPLGTRPDGYRPNGGGTVIAQDTIGTTDGTHSMKFSQVTLATFTAALTEVVPIPPAIDDVVTTAVSLDLTVPDTGAFNGGFARLGITEFGNNPSMNLNGQAAQTNGDSEQNIALAAGTYHLTIPLIARSNPITFDTDVPFSSIFGPDPNTQLQVATGFQFYINKSSDSPLLVYIDNVHVVPDFLPGDANLDGTVDTVDFNILASNFSHNGTTWQTADFNGDGSTDTVDFNLLAANFSHSRGAGPTIGSTVPEPVSMGAIGIASAALLLRRKLRISI